MLVILCLAAIVAGLVSGILLAWILELTQFTGEVMSDTTLFGVLIFIVWYILVIAYYENKNVY